MRRVFEKMGSGVLMLFPILFFTNSVSPLQPSPVKRHIVEIRGMKYHPALLVVQEGDTVQWVNKDILAHDVTEATKAWSSGPMTVGTSWQKVISETTDYYCTVHIVMKGKVLVR